MITDLIKKVRVAALTDQQLAQLEYDITRGYGLTNLAGLKNALSVASDLMNDVLDRKGIEIPAYRLATVPTFEYVNALDFSGLSAEEIAQAIAAIDRALVKGTGNATVTRGLTALKGVLATVDVPAPAPVPVAEAVVAGAPTAVAVAVEEPAPAADGVADDFVDDGYDVDVPDVVAEATAPVTGGELSLDAYLTAVVTKLRRAHVHATISVSVTLTV